MKIVTILLACISTIALAACGDKDAEDTGTDTASVETGVESE